jgi:putative ABC transport system permease protein
VSGEIDSGRWLDDALASFPTVVLGATTAERLGVTQTDGSVTVWLGEEWFVVVGILKPAPLAPELDAAALIGWPVAQELLGYDGTPTRLYERSPESSVEEIRALLPATVNPKNPEEVTVSRPSDALAAQRTTDETLTTLLLALGGVALLVGGIGVANTMVIAVLERRSEIGLRRAPRRDETAHRYSVPGRVDVAGGLGRFRWSAAGGACYVIGSGPMAGGSGAPASPSPLPSTPSTCWAKPSATSSTRACAAALASALSAPSERWP